MEEKKSSRYGRGYGKKAGHPPDLQTPYEDRCKKTVNTPHGRAGEELSREKQVSEEEMERIFTEEAPDKGLLDHH